MPIRISVRSLQNYIDLAIQRILDEAIVSGITSTDRGVRNMGQKGS
jgi:hypothetical protein